MGWADLWYILLMVGFVVLAALFVIGCDKIIGPDEAHLDDDERDELDSEREKALL